MTNPVTPELLTPSSVSAQCRMISKVRPVYTEVQIPSISSVSNLAPALTGLDGWINFPSDAVVLKGYATDELTLTSGAPTTLDLTAAPTYMPTEGLYDTLLNYYIVIARFFAPATNTDAVTIGPGASNPYNLWGAGNSIEIEPGRREGFQIDALELPQILAGAKTIQFSTTNTGDKIHYMLAAGEAPA